MKQISQTIEKFVHDTDIGNAKEKATLGQLYNSRCNNNKQGIEAKKARMDYDKMIEEMERKKN